MVTVDNLARKLLLLIQKNDTDAEIDQWRLLGQEQDGYLLFSWVQKLPSSSQTTIGLYSHHHNQITQLRSFHGVVNCIQASIDSTHTYLLYVIKDNTSLTYRPCLVNLKSLEEHDLQLERQKQAFGLFLYQKHSVLNENNITNFLVLIHHECILQYQFTNGDFKTMSFECLVRNFTWAQWDSERQTLYYIHNKKPSRSLVEGDDELVVPSNAKTSPTLSGLQFHDDLPHESVLNIPLSIPHVSTVSSSCDIYEDDTVPLRVHDCSLDLIILIDSAGYVCVCHHYLYQPIQSNTDLNDDNTALVHFAYSVTVLHQSCVLNCVVPGIPWSKAKSIRPLFKFDGEHILVLLPDICTHLLDIGAMHEPLCHIVTKPLLGDIDSSTLSLASLSVFGDEAVVNLQTLDIIEVSVTTGFLTQTFKTETNLGNKVAIIHYLILHRTDLNAASELIQWQAEKPLSLGLSTLLKEFLIGSCFAAVHRNLPSDASQYINLLPISTQHMGSELEVKINDKIVCLTQDVLWNASMMLLSPQQRIVPYRTDIWVKLWEQLAKISKSKQRFKSNQVVEKLLVSLGCYQPEILSRSSTPMSPSAALGTSGLNEFVSLNQYTRKSDGLPFYEIENCTASRQEHIISVNLRELSMHLLKQSVENRISKFQWQTQTPMHVHAVATRYITAQLEQSRVLCQILCKAVAFDARTEIEKGFVYIEQLQEERRFVLFTTLERYYLSVESIAFPLPQGFTSFFTYLGYKTLSFEMFLQYIQRNVLELQVDVMKIIMADIDGSKNGVEQKLKLLTLLPRSRAKRLLNQWNHPISLMIRAREHALNILSGVETGPVRLHWIEKKKTLKGLTAFPSDDGLSALDTFLVLLTAKASLTELDFGLLIEATEISTEEGN